MPENFNISGPGPATSGSGWTNSHHLAHLVAFVGATEEERTGNDNKKYTVALCTFVVCSTCKKAWADVPVGGQVLAPRILSAEGEIVGVRLLEGEARGGLSAPIIPEEDLTSAERQELQDLFNKYGARLRSGKIVFDVDQFNKDNEQPEPTK